MAYMKDSAGRRLDSFRVAGAEDTSKVLGDNSLCFYGDSITDMWNLVSTGTPAVTYSQGISYGRWLQTYARHRFKVTAEYGVSGENVTQAFARIATVVADPARNVFLYIGINAVSGANPESIDAMITSCKGIWDALQAAGKRVIQPTVMAARQIITSDQRRVFDQFNLWMMVEGPKRGIIVIPWHHLWMDPADGRPHGPSQTAPWVTIDGTHPSTYGAQLMGKFAADFLAPLFPENGNQLPVSNADTVNSISNAMLLTTGGNGTLNGASSALVPYQWKVTTTGDQAVSPSIVASTDGPYGNWQQLKITAGTVNSGSVQFSFDASVTPAAPWAPSTAYAVNAKVIVDGKTYNATTGGTSAASGTGPSGTGTSIADGTVVWSYFPNVLAIGDKVVARIEVDSDADFVNTSKFELDLVALTSGYSTLGTTRALQNTSSTQDIHRLRIVNGVLETPPLMIPATTAVLQFKLLFAGLNGLNGTTSTVRVRRAAIHRVPTP